MKNINNWILLFIVFLFSSNTSEKQIYKITATMSQRGVDAGMKILAEGGTAVDAVLSVALSEIAESGGKHVSYAGILDLVYYEKSTDKIHNLNASFNTVLDEKEPRTIPSLNDNMNNTLENTVSGRTILVPGFMKGVEEAHKKFGSVPFNKLFENAIEIAEQGTEWTSDDNFDFNKWKNILTKFPETKAVFTKTDGSFYEVGETFKQPALAKTLREVSTLGADYMYSGEWAEKFVTSARKTGSKITLNDLLEYEVVWTIPYQGKYKDYDIFVQGAPDLGGPRLIEALNIAEEIGLSEREHYSKSASTLATIYQILSATLYSSNLPSYYGDSINLSPNSRIDKETSKAVWEIWNNKNNLKSSLIDKNKNEHTAAIVAVDKHGNVATLIHSIVANNWGSTGLFIDGVSIPDPACFQQDMIEKVGQGKRLPTRTVPGLVLKNGRPILGFGCISGGAVNQTFVSIMNVLDFNMTPQESVEEPGIGSLSFVHDNLSLLLEPNIFTDSLLIQAKTLNAHFYESHGTMSKFWTGISIDPKTGRINSTKVWLK